MIHDDADFDEQQDVEAVAFEDFDEDEALKMMKADAVTVFVDMHEGDAEATAWGCDLTYDYVKINADYRS